MDRREFLGSAVAYWLLGQLCGQKALAAPAQLTVDRWLRQLTQECLDLKHQKISPEAWQSHLDTLYGQIDLQELIRFIDFDKLAQRMVFPPDRATTQDVQLPQVQGLRRCFGAKVFGMRKGCAVIPHAHNNMVSAHLVLKGSFHVRTYHRRFDKELPKALLVEPSLDETFQPGRLLTMSDRQDNLHWLTATSEKAFTFDVPVTDLLEEPHYPNPAGAYSMIFVDPTAKPGHDGLVRAPIIAAEEGFRRFGSTG